MRTPEGHGSDSCDPVTRQRIALSQKGERGHHWLGDAVGYGGIHKRARAALPRECAMADATCNGQLEVALKHDAEAPLRWERRGYYSPELSDYQRLCRSHHNRYDGKRPPPETRTNRGPRHAVARPIRT